MCTVRRWVSSWIAHLVVLDRERAGREASPTVAVIDSQSVKTTENRDPRGYGAGMKVMGRKRHAMVDHASRIVASCGVELTCNPAPHRSRSSQAFSGPASWHSGTSGLMMESSYDMR